MRKDRPAIRAFRTELGDCVRTVKVRGPGGSLVEHVVVWTPSGPTAYPHIRSRRVSRDPISSL